MDTDGPAADAPTCARFSWPLVLQGDHTLLRLVVSFGPPGFFLELKVPTDSEDLLVTFNPTSGEQVRCASWQSVQPLTDVEVEAATVWLDDATGAVKALVLTDRFRCELQESVWSLTGADKRPPLLDCSGSALELEVFLNLIIHGLPVSQAALATCGIFS